MKNLYKLALLLPLLTALSSCTSVSKVREGPLNQNTYSESMLCPVVGGNVSLLFLNGQDNIINPKYVDMGQTGKVSLKTDYTYSLSPNSYYTLVFYGDFSSLFFGGTSTCTGFDIEMNYPYNGTQYLNYKANKTDTFRSVVSGTYEHVHLELVGDKSQLRLEFETPYTTQGNITLSKLEFVFDNTFQRGKVTGTQMYNGRIKDFPGSNLSYNHDLCLPSLDENYEGPFKDGHEYPITVEYGSVPSAESLRKTLLAYDVSEGNYTEVKLVEDGLKGKENVLDTPLDVVFESSDSSNNKSRFTYKITIKDTCKPTIKIIDSNRKISYVTKITEDLLLQNYKIEDNYPKGIKKVEVLNLDTSKENFVGILTYQIKATDISGNVETFDSSVSIIDDVIPTIEGPLELDLSANDPQSISQILANYKAHDVISGDLQVEVKNENYTANQNRPGTYVINLEAKDKSGNIGKLTVKAVVQDKEGPIFYVNKTTITTFSKKTLDTETILNCVIKQGALPMKNYTSCEIIEGEYGLVEEVKDYGTYNIKLLAHADDDTSEIALVTIEVKEKQNEKISFFAKIKLFFINLWDRIVKFFTGSY